LTCFGKVIGGGLPAAAYGGSADLMERVAPVGPVYQAGTLSGNPLAMSAGMSASADESENGVGLAGCNDHCQTDAHIEHLIHFFPMSF